MTDPSEPRVPHDPVDLRDMVSLLRELPAHSIIWTGDDAALADRLEAWANDLEGDEQPDPFGAGMEAGHKDLLVMNEDRRQRVRNILADYFNGDFNFVDHLIARLHHEGFEIVTTDAVYRAPKIGSERLAPLEAAVLDAAKRWFAGEAVPGLYDAVRALQEATDA